MNTTQLLNYLELKNPLTPNIRISGGKIDSRKITNGEIFFAYKGNNVDGNKFIDHAFNNGASIVFTSDKSYVKNNRIIFVKNVTNCLLKVAEFWISHFTPIKIAITGSNGKTTLKETIAKLLEKEFGKGSIISNEGNQNNQIGVPLNILKLQKKHKYAIFELGMNSIGEISLLSKILKPNYSIITNIGTAHIGELGSQEKILKAKIEIVDGMDSKGILLIDNEDKYANKIKSLIKEKLIIKDIGSTNMASATWAIKNKVSYSFKYNQQNLNFFLKNQYGKHLLKIFAFTGLLAFLLNVKIIHLKKTIESFLPLVGRQRIINPSKTLKIIDDSYNANYESMIAAINYINNFESNNIIVFGEIGELGKFSTDIHTKIAKYLHKNFTGIVIGFGPQTKVLEMFLKDNFFYTRTHDQILKILHRITRNKSCTLLFKGSRLNKLDIVIKDLLNYYKEKI
jgi:UDP-N-acetylmuramoyl-tripeptide--D-alanyl-D-alanine ligase